MAEVQVRSLRKSFGEVEVIRGIDVDIRDGDFAVIVGPSGCGKSMLLRIIAGLEGVSDGDVFIGGEQVNDVEPKDRNIAMVFQNYALYPHMSVAQNMSFGLELRRMPKSEIQARVARAARVLQLQDYLDRRPRQLSGGQRQRVAMGRAIVREPAVFLFDEPLSNLDAKLRVQMRLEIKKLHQELDATSVYVTHDQVEAMTMGDRLIVMNGGVVEQMGSPLDIYLEPATTFVAGFIGSPPMNFLPGEVRDRVVDLGPTAQVPLNGHDVAPGAVTAGLRPEHLELVNRPDASFSLQVSMVEPQGAETLVHGQIGRSPMTVRLPGINGVRPGEELPIRVDPAHLHLFDCDSGRRLG